MWKNIIAGIRQRLTRETAKRLGWYGALAALLTILGTASAAYRDKSGVDAGAGLPTPEPLAAMSVGTPEPIPALFTAPTPEPTPEPLSFCWPLEGEVIGAFAPEALVWSETLGQWQSHPGIDIAASAGEAVVSCAEGTVTEAWDDPLWGYVIEIGHREGYVSTYANLGTLNLVQIGDAVAAGQIIAAVGSTADCESEMPWHLHFELTKDGMPLDASKLMD